MQLQVGQGCQGLMQAPGQISDKLGSKFKINVQ